MIAKVSKIKNNPNNPRIVRDEKYKKLLNSIKEFPEMLEKRPLVCFTKDDSYIVLGGNMRLKAIKELKIEEVEITLADDWTQEQKDRFIIADNVSFGSWDFDALANNWDQETLIDWGLDGLDFGNVEEPDYSLLDDADNDKIEQMEGDVKKAIQIEFTPDDYVIAYELCQFARSKKVYIGEFLINILKDIKDGYEKQD